jgi:ubiquinone/menaquinone biosynthesis C-methylase UbiE
MRRPTFIARQSGQPSGVIGRLLGWVMERETAAQNDAAVAALTLRPDDRVLETGYGPGRTLEQLAAAVPCGFVAGVDHSQTMYETARRRCAASIARGRVEVQTGDSRALPYPDSHFDKALAVHTLYFWRDPALHLREVYRVLKRRHGVCVLGFRPQEDPHAADFPETVYTFHTRDSVRRILSGVGFADVELSEPVPGFVLARASRQR